MSAAGPALADAVTAHGPAGVSAGERHDMLYLYGITRATPPPPLDLTMKAAVRFVVHEGLAAMVEAVSPSEFSPEVLEQRLGSVEWVAGIARRHEAMLETIMQSAPVIPARLCTLFSHVNAVEQLLAERAVKLSATLDRIAGAEEWSVKMYYDEEVLRRHASSTDTQALALGEALAIASPGQAHVLRKKRNARVVEVVAAHVVDTAEYVLDEIEQHDVETCLRQLLPEGATHRQEKMGLNVAVLVGDRDAEAFFATLDSLAAKLATEGFVLEKNGPFPPYSFTRGDDEEESDE